MYSFRNKLRAYGYNLQFEQIKQTNWVTLESDEFWNKK